MSARWVCVGLVTCLWLLLGASAAPAQEQPADEWAQQDAIPEAQPAGRLAAEPLEPTPPPPVPLVAAPTPQPIPTPSPTPTPEITVSSDSPHPLVVNGVATSKLPVTVPPGSHVCVAQERFYASEGDRWTFAGWAHGSPEGCVVLTQAGVYRSLFEREVLMHVRSAVASLQRSMWVPYGVPVELDAPEMVSDGNGERTRFRFLQWSEGESPFERSNVIVPMKPVSVEAKWLREYQVTVDGPPFAELKGSGWYADGATLTVQAPELAPGGSAAERWKFGRWEGVAFPPPVIANPQNPTSVVKVDAPYTVRAVYDRQFLVHARSPLGTIRREWVKEGQEVVLETPPIIELIPERERLVFRKWEGMDDLVSPRIGGPVDRPMIVAAAYARELMLRVNAPYGSAGAGWQRAGTVISVSVPASIPQPFLQRSSLDYLSGYPTGQAAVAVLMDEPKVLTAFYRTEVDSAPLALLLATPALMVILYRARRLGAGLPRRSSPPDPPGRGEQLRRHGGALGRARARPRWPVYGPDRHDRHGAGRAGRDPAQEE